MTKDEALKLALEALKHTHPSALTSFYTIGDRDKAIKAIQEHLAQPEQEYDWKDLYEKEKRKSAMWLAKYEEVAGPASKAIPVAQSEQEPVAYLCENAVGYKYFRWKKPSSIYKPIALYTRGQA